MRPSPERFRSLIPPRAPGALMALMPGALTVALAFDGGGYFVSATALATLAMLMVLIARVLLATHPAAGFGPLLAAAVVAFAAFALWTLLSGGWSNAPSRALVEFDRALLYLATLVTFASLGGQAWRLRWMVRGMAAAALVVCGISLTSRLLPDVWPIAEGVSGSTRLSYPVSYWNSLGLMAALGMVMCFGLTSSTREPRTVRILAAAAMPVLGSTLMLTLSRGSIAAGGVGLIVLAIVGHPRALLTGLAATLPATVIAVTRAYDAEFLVSDNPLTRAARDQGEHVALVVALCVAGAALVRALLLISDRALLRRRPRLENRRAILAVGAAAFAVIGAGAAVAIDLPRQYDRFVDAEPQAQVNVEADGPRDRLTIPDDNGRIDQWRVALDQFEAAPLSGSGAGTYELSWRRNRPDTPLEVRDAHSLYLEVMSELGLVGLTLLGGALLAILSGLARRIRGPDHTLFATVFAGVVTWAVAAGADWHWEMPVVTLWVFALGGVALARHEERAAGRILATAPRFVLAGVLWALTAVVPLQLHASQDRLESAIVALASQRCDLATGLAERSLNAVGSRPQPYEIIAYCAAEQGQVERAIGVLEQAIRRDPDNWRPRYGLAVAQARAGRDPRGAARAALRRNPRSELALDAVKRFEATGAPGAWRRAASQMKIVVPFT